MEGGGYLGVGPVLGRVEEVANVWRRRRTDIENHGAEPL